MKHELWDITDGNHGFIDGYHGLITDDFTGI